MVQFSLFVCVLGGETLVVEGRWQYNPVHITPFHTVGFYRIVIRIGHGSKVLVDAVI